MYSCDVILYSIVSKQLIGAERLRTERDDPARRLEVIVVVKKRKPIFGIYLPVHLGKELKIIASSRAGPQVRLDFM